MADRLHALLEPTVNALGYELWGIEHARSGADQLLRLYIDTADGVTVEDCEAVSRQVGDLLEAEQAMRGDYTLEVSSPGLDRLLFTPDQHRRYLGEAVQLRLRNPVGGRRRLTGRLREVGAEAVWVETDGEAFEVPFADIERARLVPDYKRPTHPG